MRLGIGIDLWAKGQSKPLDRSRQDHPANPRPRPQSAPAPQFEDDYVPPGDPAPVIPMKKPAAGSKATNLMLATAPQVATVKKLLEQTKMGLLDATQEALGNEVATVENLSKGDASALIKYLIEQKEGQ